MTRDVVVGVDFASDGVRLAAVRHGAEPRVIATHAYRWPIGAWRRGVLAKPAVVREALRQAFVESELPTDRIVLGIGGDEVHRVIVIPSMTDTELAEQIQWEAEQYVPDDVSELQLEYRVIDRDAAAGTMRVVLAGVRRETLEAHITVAREAELSPRAAELEVEALRRVVVAAGAVADDRATALVRASNDGARVVVLRGSEVVFSRDDAVVDVAEGAAQTQRALDFHEATGDGPVERVLVAGPEADAWESQLRERLTAPVQRWGPDQLRCEGGIDIATVSDFATAIGLALPGPRMHTVGAPAPRPGLWSKLKRMLGGD